MVSPRNAGPFNWNIPIVDPATGRPTPEFLRKWSEQTNWNGSIAELAAAVEALRLVQIIAGAGLDGGGVLGDGGPITLELDANTLARLLPAGGVLGQVLTKTDNADFVTDWLDPTGGGNGTGGYFNGATGALSGASSSAFATKAMVFTPTAPCRLSHIWAAIDGSAAGNAHRAVLATGDPITGVVDTVLATSTDVLTVSTDMVAYRFPFTDEIDLEPGVSYLLAVVNASGGGTTVLRVGTSAAGTTNTWAYNAPGLGSSVAFGYNTIGLTAAQAPSTIIAAGGYYCIWPEGFMAAGGWNYDWGMDWGG